MEAEALRRLEARLESAEASRAQAHAAARRAAAEAATSQAKAAELEAGLEAAKAEVAELAGAQAAAEEEARVAKAEAKAVREKARALLGQQEEEMRRRSTLPPANGSAVAAPTSAPVLPPPGTIELPPLPSSLMEQQANGLVDWDGAAADAADGPTVVPTAAAVDGGGGGASAASGVAKGSGGGGEGSGTASGDDEMSALHRYALAQARLQAEVTQERTRRQSLEGELSAAHADLQQTRQHAVLQGEGGNMAYLRHVVAKFIEMEGTDESEALFAVIATYLQFDEAEVVRLQLSRAQRRAAARGGFLRLLRRG